MKTTKYIPIKIKLPNIILGILFLLVLTLFFNQRVKLNKQANSIVTQKGLLKRLEYRISDLEDEKSDLESRIDDLEYQIGELEDYSHYHY